MLSHLALAAYCRIFFQGSVIDTDSHGNYDSTVTYAQRHIGITLKPKLQVLGIA